MNQQKFSIRKTAFGAASVQVATLVALAGIGQATVAADTVPTITTETVAATETPVTEADIRAAETDLTDAQREVSSAQANLNAKVEAEALAQEDLDTAKHMAEEAEVATPETIENYNASIRALDEDLAADQEEMSRVDNLIATAAATTVRDNADLASATTAFNTATNNVTEARQVAVSAEAAAATADTNRQQAEAELQTARTAVETATQTLNAAKETLRNLQAGTVSSADLNAALVTARAELATAEQRLAQLQTQDADLTRQIQDIKTQLDRVDGPVIYGGYYQPGVEFRGNPNDDYMGSDHIWVIEGSEDRVNLSEIAALPEDVRYEVGKRFTVEDRINKVGGRSVYQIKELQPTSSNDEWTSLEPLSPDNVKAWNEGRIFDHDRLAQIFSEILNEERTRLGKAPVRVNIEDQYLAELRALELARHGSSRINSTIPHKRPDGVRSFSTIYEENGFMKPLTAGENTQHFLAGRNMHWFLSERHIAESMFEQWKESQPHYVAMTSDRIEEIGVGIKMTTAEDSHVAGDNLFIGVLFMTKRYYNTPPFQNQVDHPERVKPRRTEDPQVALLQEQLNNLTAQQTTIAGDIATATANRVAKDSAVRRAEQAVRNNDTAQNNVSIAQARVDEATRALADAKAAVTAARIEVESTRHIAENTNGQLLEARLQLADKERSLQEAEVRLEQAKTKAKTSKNALEGVQLFKTNLRDNIRDLTQRRTRLESYRDVLVNLMRNQEEAEQRVREAEENLRTAQGNKDEAIEQLNRAISNGDEKQRVLEDLRARFVRPVITDDEETNDDTTISESPNNDVNRGTTTNEAPNNDVNRGTTTNEAPNKDVNRGTTTNEAPNNDVNRGTTTNEVPNNDVNRGTTTNEAPNNDVNRGTTTNKVPNNALNRGTTTNEVPNNALNRGTRINEDSKNGVNDRLSNTLDLLHNQPKRPDQGGAHDKSRGSASQGVGTTGSHVLEGQGQTGSAQQTYTSSLTAQPAALGAAQKAPVTRHVLPQTGEQSGLVLLGVGTLLASLGLVARRRYDG